MHHGAGLRPEIYECEVGDIWEEDRLDFEDRPVLRCGGTDEDHANRTNVVVGCPWILRDV